MAQKSPIRGAGFSRPGGNRPVDSRTGITPAPSGRGSRLDILFIQQSIDIIRPHPRTAEVLLRLAGRTTYPGDSTVCPREATALLEGHVWSPGSVIRRKYRTLGEIGRGGMGAVYKAERVHFGELRALKAMTPALVDQRPFRQRFQQEAIFARKLQHPRITTNNAERTMVPKPVLTCGSLPPQSAFRTIGISRHSIN